MLVRMMLAVVVNKLSFIADIDKVFKIAENRASLVLRFSKSCIVPLGGADESDEFAAVSAWISSHLPSWQEVPMKQMAQYLGVWIGKGALCKMWEEPVAKWIWRSFSIGRSAASSLITSSAYRKRALPCLSYIAQFTLPPFTILHDELRVQASLLRYPYCTLSPGAVSELRLVGGPELPLAFPYCLAALARFARSTTTVWRPLFHRILAAAAEHLPFDRFWEGFIFSERWGSAPFVAYAAWAYASFPEPTRSSGFAGLRPSSSLFALKRWQDVQRGASSTLSYLQAAFASGDVRVKVQRAYRDRLSSAIYRPRLFNSWISKWRKLGIPDEFLNALVQSDLFDFLNSLPPCISIQVIRSWAFGWFTSHRVRGADVLPCPFGCLNEVDSQAPLLSCPWTFAMLPAIAGIAARQSLSARLALDRSPLAAHALAIVSKAYHLVRAKSAWISACLRQDHQVVLLLWRSALVAATSRHAFIRYW